MPLAGGVNPIGSHVEFALSALHLLAYGGALWSAPANLLARRLTMGAFAFLIAALPESLCQFLEE